MQILQYFSCYIYLSNIEIGANIANVHYKLAHTDLKNE